MKAHIAKHEKVRSQSLICVLCVFGVVLSAMALGSLRLYGLYMEHRLANVVSRIEAMTRKNAELEERYSSLLSPSRIYNYARSELNMVTAQEVETIKLNGAAHGSVSVAEARPAQVIEISEPSFFEFMLSFTGAAYAQD